MFVTIYIKSIEATHDIISVFDRNGLIGRKRFKVRVQIRMALE
jgi:hypothetical protein